MYLAMRKANCLLSFLFLLIASTSTVQAEAVLLFSDIESGPNTGWSTDEPNKGAAVSIWGYGFGDTQGSSFVSVNGIAIESNTDYAVWGEYWPTQYFQRITFWLNGDVPLGAGEITVTVDGVQSNPLPFTVRDGNIFFITESNPGGDGSHDNPYDVRNSDSDWVDGMVPGDIYYFRDGLIYDEKYNGGNSIIWIRNSEPSGTADMPIALLGYPGETPEMSIPIVDSNFNNGVKLDNNYIVFSGFLIDSEWAAASVRGDFNRLIGIDAIGLKNYHFSGTGILVSGSNSQHSGDGNVILGNAIHGGNSQNRFDHAIYLSGCSDNTGVKVGWNHIYDNDFGRGPIIVVNHQENRCDDGQVLDAHFIFNNIIDCNAQRSRAIGVYDLSYDDGEEAPEPTYVYNNLVISCGTFDDTDSHVGYTAAMSQSARGEAHFYYNTLYDAGYVGFRIGSNVSASFIKNNIVHMTPDFPGPTGNHYHLFTDESVGSLSNNLYFGLGDYTPCDNCAEDLDNISNQDPLFVDSALDNFKLQDDSPAIGSGTDDLFFEIAPPAYAPISRDIDFVLRNNPPALGAYAQEFAVADPDLSCVITYIPINISGPTECVMTVRVQELMNSGTAGPITVVFPRDDRLQFTYEPTAIELGPIPVDNIAWTYDDSNPSFHIWTSTASINALSSSTFGFEPLYDPQNTYGTTPFSVTILTGSGGEVNGLNNTDAETILFFSN